MSSHNSNPTSSSASEADAESMAEENQKNTFRGRKRRTSSQRSSFGSPTLQLPVEYPILGREVVRSASQSSGGGEVRGMGRGRERELLVGAGIGGMSLGERARVVEDGTGGSAMEEEEEEEEDDDDEGYEELAQQARREKEREGGEVSPGPPVAVGKGLSQVRAEIDEEKRKVEKDKEKKESKDEKRERKGEKTEKKTEEKAIEMPKGYYAVYEAR